METKFLPLVWCMFCWAAASFGQVSEDNITLRVDNLFRSISFAENYEATPASAASIYTENFMNGNPGNWTVVDENKDGKSWLFISAKDIKLDFGVAAIMGNNNTANDWLISPNIAIPTNASNVSFSFFVLFDSDEKLEVRISDSDKNITSFKDLIGIWNLIGATESNPQAGISVPKNINKYIGKRIYLAFVNKSTNSNLMAISQIKIVGDLGTGIEEMKNVNIPIVYVQDKTIHFNNVEGNGEAEIFDITGKLHHRIPVSSGTSQYVTAPGIYIVKLKSNNQAYDYKVIVH